MNCKFDALSCSPECPKFSVCMFNSIQSQISEIQSQLSFILNTLAQYACETGINKERINIIEANTTDIVSTLIEITNDSEKIQLKKESEK
jgi:hypothetical protein